MVRRSSGAPSRGQWPPRWRSTCRSPVCEPPRRSSVAMVERRRRRRRRSSSRSRSRPAGPGRAGPPQRLVDEQVADAGDAVLVEQPGLQRRPAAAQRLDDLADRDRPGVGTEPRQVRVELDPAEAPRVGHPQPPPSAKRSAKRSHVGWSRPDAYSSRSIGAVVVDHEPAGHAEAQAEHRPFAGEVDEQAACRAASCRRTDRALDGGDHVRWRAPPFRNQASGASTPAIVATDHPLGEPPVELDLDQLRHGPVLPASPGGAVHQRRHSTARACTKSAIDVVGVLEADRDPDRARADAVGLELARA